MVSRMLPKTMAIPAPLPASESNLLASLRPIRSRLWLATFAHISGLTLPLRKLLIMADTFDRFGQLAV